MARRGVRRWWTILVWGTPMAAVVLLAGVWEWTALARHSAIQDLQELPVGGRVRLIGVVTYADEPGRRIWIEDETGAVAMGMDPARAGVQAGETVAVEAVKTAGYDPLTGPSSVGLRVLRVRRSPVAVKAPPLVGITLNNFPRPEKNGIRVQVLAVVRAVSRDSTGQEIVSIASSGYEIGMTVAHPDADLTKAIDAEVRIMGVPEEERDAAGAVTSEKMWVNRGEDVEVVKAAPGVAPLTTLQRLNAGSVPAYWHRVRLRGRVAAVDAESLLVKDRWGAIACQLFEPVKVTVGAAVEVEGFPTSEGQQINLYDATVRSISEREEAADGVGESGAGEAVLHTVKAVHGLEPAMAAEALPVELRGVITYDDPIWRQMWVQDGTGGIFAKYSKGQRVRAGDRVRVRGVTGPGNFAPVILSPAIEVEGRGKMPAPEEATLAKATAGVLDSQYVRIEGIVRRLKYGESPQHAMLAFDLETALGKVHVSTTPGFPYGEEQRKLSDAEVRIDGAFGTIYNSRRQLVGYQMLVSRPGQIEVLEGAKADPFAAETTPVAALLSYSPRARVGHRVKVAGAVTLEGADFLYLQDATGGVEIRGETRGLNPGEVVEAVGYPALEGRYTPVMTDAVFRRVGRRENVTAAVTNPERILTGQQDLTLVTVEGRLLTAAHVPSGETLVLRSGAWTYTAQLDTTDKGAAFRNLRDGSVLRLTGICSTQVDPSRIYRLLEEDPVTFRILLRSAGDVTLVHAAPFWTPETTLILLALCSVAMLTILAWAGVLRRRVRMQRVELERAQETEQAMRDLSLAMQEVTKEQRFDRAVSVRGSEDIARLVVGFNTMLVELRERDEAKREAEARLQHMALIDELTGLPNRRLLSDRLTQTLARARREGRKVAALYIDLDGFKLVNDSLGHRIGDVLLGQVAQRLLARKREADTLARIGGDEFTLVLDQVGGEEDAEQAAKSLLEALGAPFEIEGHLIRVGASIGISVFPEHGNSPDHLLQQADCAMYAAKRNGKNRIVHFGDDLGNAARERLTLEGELRRALAEREITVQYQPEFDLKTNAVVRFEALARWIHPHLGPIPPLNFIPVAEESGLILPLGAYILEQACRDAAGWQQVAGRPVQVAVNVSSVQFAQDEFLEELEEILERTGLDPRLLQIELTESATVTGIERAAKLMRLLNARGVSVAMDDFGTGYSCLSYLPRLSFSALKIDRSFVNELMVRAETRAFVQSILTMAHNLRMKVIVEGIETREQLELVRELGADEAQGYLLGRPTAHPAKELRKLEGLRVAMEPVALEAAG